MIIGSEFIDLIWPIGSSGWRIWIDERPFSGLMIASQRTLDEPDILRRMGFVGWIVQELGLIPRWSTPRLITVGLRSLGHIFRNVSLIEMCIVDGQPRRPIGNERDAIVDALTDSHHPVARELVTAMRALPGRYS